MDRIRGHHPFARRMHRPVHPRYLEIHRVRRRLARDRDVHRGQHRNRHLYVCE